MLNCGPWFDLHGKVPTVNSPKFLKDTSRQPIKAVSKNKFSSEKYQKRAKTTVRLSDLGQTGVYSLISMAKFPLSTVPIFDERRLDSLWRLYAKIETGSIDQF